MKKKARGEERLNIPAECYVVKPWFPERPSEDVVAEIKRFIQETGEPHMWPGHTHTKPPASAEPIYLATFDLPSRCLSAKRFAPCPCCWPDIPKYGYEGKIAWFPGEAVIRAMGPECFAALNPEGHAAAMETLNREKRQRATNAYLLESIPQLPALLNRVDRAIEVSKAIDEFRSRFRNALSLYGIDLWRYSRNGELKIIERKKEARRDRKTGDTYLKDVDVERTSHQLPGYRMFDPGLKSWANRLLGAREKIATLVLKSQTEIDAMDDAQRAATASSIDKVVKVIVPAFADLQHLQRFVQPVAINSLKNWSAHDGAPIHRHFAHRGGSIEIGYADSSVVPIEIPNELLQPLGDIGNWQTLAELAKAA